jgi:hypothetical protein
VQLVGVLDLVLVPGLLFGRPRSPWLTVRAVSNVATAAFVLRRASNDTLRRNARVFSGAMAVATVADVLATRGTSR